MLSFTDSEVECKTEVFQMGNNYFPLVYAKTYLWVYLQAFKSHGPITHFFQVRKYNILRFSSWTKRCITSEPNCQRNIQITTKSKVFFPQGVRKKYLKLFVWNWSNYFFLRNIIFDEHKQRTWCQKAQLWDVSFL